MSGAQQRKKVRDEIQRLGAEITDHVLIRYMERALGFDIPKMREDLAKKCRGAMIAGATKIKIDGIHFIVKDGALITAVPAKDKR